MYINIYMHLRNTTEKNYFKTVKKTKTLGD